MIKRVHLNILFDTEMKLFFSSTIMHKTSSKNGYVRYFDNNNKYINLLVCEEELLKNTIKDWINLKIHLKKSLIMNQCITNTLRSQSTFYNLLLSVFKSHYLKNL